MVKIIKYIVAFAPLTNNRFSDPLLTARAKNVYFLMSFPASTPLVENADCKIQSTDNNRIQSTKVLCLKQYIILFLSVANMSNYFNVVVSPLRVNFIYFYISDFNTG